MKIRFGFISNSSTTSFCIYGVDLGELMPKLKKGLTNIEEKTANEWGEFFEKKGLEVHFDYEGDPFVGLSWSTVGDNETGLQFKKKIEKILETVFKQKVKCETIEVAYTDG